MTYNKNVLKKLYSYFTQRLGMKPSANGWISGDCPDCGKKKKFGINLFQDRSNCFVCGYNKKPIFIIMQLEGYELQVQAWNFLKTFENADYLNLDTLESSFIKDIPKHYKNVSLPEGYKVLALGDSQLAKSARTYIKSRGFNTLTLSYKGIGYCDKGEYLGCIIIPYYSSGKLVYFQARRFIELGAKFKNPKVEDFGIGKTMLMYNPDALAIYQKVYLFESATNCLTMGDKATGILGKKLSNYQHSMIIRSPVKRVVIGLDDDAYKEAIELGLSLIKHKEVKILKVPKKQDINNIGKKATLLLEKQEKYLTYGELMALKNSL